MPGLAAVTPLLPGILNGLSEVSLGVGSTMNGDGGLEQPCLAQLLPGPGDSAAVLPAATSARQMQQQKISSKPKKLIIFLSAVIFIQVIALVFLIYDKLISDQLSNPHNTDKCSQTYFKPGQNSDYFEPKEQPGVKETLDVPADYLTELDYSEEDAAFKVSTKFREKQQITIFEEGTFYSVHPRVSYKEI